ncbi:MAG: acetate--CoA ligase family protein [Archaeoglobaceae archaeon]
MLLEHEAKEILEKYGIRTARCIFAESEEKAVSAARQIGFPVVMKVASRKIVHKSDVNGVRLNVKSEEEVRRNFNELMAIDGAEGVNVQPMLQQGIEVIVGVAENEQFGSVAMFGLGGVFVEVLKDVSFRLLPITKRDAEEMVREIKGYRILQGYRGKKADISAIVDLLLKINDVVEKESVVEMDLNPVFVYENGYAVADARMVVGKRKNFNYELGDLSVLFNPRSVAVVGASREAGKPGNQVILNLQNMGFEGKIFPVNPKVDFIYGLKCYPSVKDIPEEVDIAIIAVPSKFVPSVIEECVAKKIKGAIVLSGGFSEGWEKGAEIEKRMVEIAKKNGMRILGPNTMGILDMDGKFTSFFSYLLKIGKGNIGVVAQSGAFANFSLLYLHHIGVSRILALGNTADVTEYEALNFLCQDEKTKVIAAYFEGFKNGRALYEVMKSCKKPIVVLKSGRTEAGKRSALSHTASLSTSEEVFDAVCKQARVVKTRDFEELVDAVKAISLQPLPKGDRVAIIEPSGAECVMSADAVEEHGLRLAKYSDISISKLYDLVPEWHSINNPLDLYPFIERNGDRVLFDVIKIFMEDEGIDAIISGLFIPSLPNLTFELDWVKSYEKPLYFTLKYEIMELFEIRRKIETLGFPVYPTPERAVRALKHSLIAKEKIGSI